MTFHRKKDTFFHNKGFTLIEIVGAIVLVGVIALITVPVTIRVVKEVTRRSFYASAEGIIKATAATTSTHENTYSEYFYENDSITFKFSKSEGKYGESVELVGGEKVTLSFDGKSPIGGIVRLYKNGDIEVVNLTDGVYYANKDADNELRVSDTTDEMTRKELQELVENLQKKIETLEGEHTELKNKDKELDEKINGITGNVNEQILQKTYPIGSIYISTSSTNPSTIFGGTWVAYAPGKVLAGINTSDTNFNAVGKTGGAYTRTLTTANLPAHTHTLTPTGTVTSTFKGAQGTTSSVGHSHTFTGGSTSTTGNHTHIVQSYNSAAGHSTWKPHNAQVMTWGVFTVGAQYQGVEFPSHGAALGMDNAGNHSHTVTGTISGNGAHTHTLTPTGTVTSTFKGTAGTTSSVGSGTAFNIMQPYITVYMWRRTG